jgi:hypothetical protein
MAATAILHRRPGSRSPRFAASIPLGNYLADEVRQITVLKFGTGGIKCEAHGASRASSKAVSGRIKGKIVAMGFNLTNFGSLDPLGTSLFPT